jgi:hypothetical protein
MSNTSVTFPILFFGWSYLFFCFPAFFSKPRGKGFAPFVWVFRLFDVDLFNHTSLYRLLQYVVFHGGCPGIVTKFSIVYYFLQITYEFWRLCERLPWVRGVRVVTDTGAIHPLIDGFRFSVTLMRLPVNIEGSFNSGDDHYMVRQAWHCGIIVHHIMYCSVGHY